MARQKRRTIYLEKGWAFMQKGITKLKNILEGKPEPQFSSEDFMMHYTTVYFMRTQKPPNDYSQQLYDKYRESIEEYITSVALPSLREKHDVLMLRELVLRWSNHKFMIYQEIKGQVKDAVIALIEKEREGEQIDKVLLKNVLGIFVEIGLGQMDRYENDFEDFLLKDTTEYYSVKAQSWILKDSFRDCMIKAEECLKREKERVGHYLHISSEQKLLEKVQNVLLAQYATRLLELEFKMEHSAFSAFLRDGKLEDSWMCRHFSKSTCGSEPISNMSKTDVTNEGTALVKQAEDSAIYKKPEKKDMVGMQEQVSLRKIFKQLGKSTLTGWTDLPAELLAAIFSRLPDSTYQSRVCVQWLRADLMLQRPVLWMPVQVDSLPEDSLLVPIDKACAPPNLVQLSPDHADIEPYYRYSYSVAPGPTLDSDLRFVGGTSGSPLFVDDRQRCLVVLRLSHLPGAKGSSAEATVLRIPLPEGVEPLDIYIGCMAVSSSRTGSKNWLPAGITSVLVVTRSGLLGVRGEHRSRWSRIGTTETANQTFVSILLAKQPDGESGCNDATTCATDSYILLDDSMRLVMVSLSLSSDATVMNLQEMPVEGGIQNLLLQSDLRATWLLYLPKSDHSGDDIIVCLAYLQFNHLSGCFVAYDLVDTPRHWVKRVSISTGYCVFVSWGTGAAAFGYPFPLRVGLMSRRIYDCQNGLKSYSLGLNYANSHGILPPVTSLRWPFSLWMVPAFPPCLQVGDDTRKPVNREDVQPEKRDMVGMQEQAFKQKIIKLRDGYVHKAFKEAFDVYCNNCGILDVELLATLFDNVLKKPCSEKLNDEAIEYTLEMMVSLLPGISDKDLFAEFYSKKLVRRLLYGTSANDEHERSILIKVKQHCGVKFTSKMEGMLN